MALYMTRDEATTKTTKMVEVRKVQVGSTAVDLVEVFTGLVVDTFENNLAYDSYFNAVYLDPVARQFKEYEYGSTAYHTVSSAKVDADDDLKDIYRTYLTVRRLNATSAYLTVGKTAKVVKGKKVTIGTTGEVVRTGKNKFGEWLQLSVDGELVFVSKKNCVAVQTGDADQLQSELTAKIDAYLA